ncbi:MAG: lysophospholipid acyltransferase family protein [Bacteroidia bacterium]|nr:lysophospholipid acyltransferase family protein [Bacteroidia bacterium]
MSAIGYYILLPFIYFAAILPFPLFYVLSDFNYFLVYHVLGYRKKVVLQNLRNSFPEKSDEEIKKISRKFYRYLCDLFLETFKTLVISKESMKQHCRFHPSTIELFEKYNAKKQSVILVLGHFGNWEWAGNTFGITCKQQLYVIYHPFTNKKFGNLIVKMRTRFGTKLIPMKETVREMIRKKDEITATAFIADQTPPVEGAYWTTFLNQETPIFNGTEKIARKMNYPVVYVSLKKIKRGYYEVFAETLCETPKTSGEGEISELHTKRLEKDIRQTPELWLWSHRRWKHKKPLNL